MTQTQSPSISNETANAWAASLGDDLWGNNLPGVNLVNEYLDHLMELLHVQRINLQLELPVD